jgi:hypothetical protein
MLVLYLGYFLHGLHIRKMMYILQNICGNGEKQASQCRGGLHPREPPKNYKLNI